jgi:hypothetical protein
MVALQASRMLGRVSLLHKLVSTERAYFCARQVLPEDVEELAPAVEVTDWAVATAAKAAMATKNFILIYIKMSGNE